jgi:hypothetical protein
MPLSSQTYADVGVWLDLLTLEDLEAMGGQYRVRSEKNGTVFESAWHHDFIPNWNSEGLERALRAHAAAYLRANNAWVKANGVEDEALATLLKARETLIRLARVPRQPQGKRFPGSLGDLLRRLGFVASKRSGPQGLPPRR